jgi:hypothetical protein
MHALNYILDFLNVHRNYYRFHKSTFAADEVFFHTILLNSADEKMRGSICNAHKRYIKWLDTTMGHPEILRKKDYDEMVNSDALFARKFDMEVDHEILDLIDENCLSGAQTKQHQTALFIS